MKPSHSTGRNVIAILAIPIVMLFLIVATPFSLGIGSPFDLCGMVDAGSRATSLSFICRGVFYEDGIPTGIWRSKLPLLGTIDGCFPHFSLEPQTMNYLIDDQPLDSITLAYDYAPNTDERHMNQVLDMMLGQCGLTEEAGRTIYSNQKLKRTELRRVGIIKGRNGAAYWDAWATRDKGEFGHSTYGKCSSYFVRFYITKTCCKAPLWICINQQHFLSLSGKSNSKIYGCGGFSNSTFLV